MDYDFLYNLKLKDSGFKSKLGSNFSSRHKNTFMAEYKQALSSPKKSQKVILKKKLPLSTNSLMHTPSNVFLPLNHYQSLTCFKEKLSVPPSPVHSHHSKRKSQDFSNNDLCSVVSSYSIVKATEIVRRHGLRQCTLSYKRQLREFCMEFLSNYKRDN